MTVSGPGGARALRGDKARGLMATRTVAREVQVVVCGEELGGSEH